MRHIPHQNELLQPSSLDLLVEISLGKRAGKVLYDDSLAIRGRQLLKLLLQGRARGEYRRSGRDGMDHMDDFAACIAIFLEETCDRRPGSSYVGDSQCPVGILILLIDQQQAQNFVLSL